MCRVYDEISQYIGLGGILTTSLSSALALMQSGFSLELFLCTTTSVPKHRLLNLATKLLLFTTNSLLVMHMYINVYDTE